MPRSGVDAPLLGLVLRELRLPVAVIPQDCASIPSQVPTHCRPRICLLKGCERWFSPPYGLSRYCSKPCADAARLWLRRQAAQRYRASEQRKVHRRQQACRYRERVRKRRKEASPPAAEGQPYRRPVSTWEKTQRVRRGWKLLVTTVTRAAELERSNSASVRASPYVESIRWPSRITSSGRAPQGTRTRFTRSSSEGRMPGST